MESANGGKERENGNNMDNLITIKEFARKTSLSIWTVYRLLKLGLPCVRVGRAIRMSQKSIEWLTNGGAAPKRRTRAKRRLTSVG
jgi:predicted DNA-binding transcriptional regulator AlpA